MPAPSSADITVDPERAILHTLDVAAAMTSAMLRVFFPVDGITVPAQPGLHLVNCIVRDARTLRRAIADYSDFLHHDADRQSAFPF